MQKFYVSFKAVKVPSFMVIFWKVLTRIHAYTYIHIKYMTYEHDCTHKHKHANTQELTSPRPQPPHLHSPSTAPPPLIPSLLRLPPFTLPQPFPLLARLPFSIHFPLARLSTIEFRKRPRDS